jgi:hypothetical protein
MLRDSVCCGGAPANVPTEPEPAATFELVTTVSAEDEDHDDAALTF